MRERVTLTLESALLKQIDRSIDGFHIKNRSHAVEMLLYKSIGGNMPTKALILAGGKKTVLSSVFKKTPHVLTPIQKKTVIEHLIDLFRKYGVTDIIVALHYDADVIKKELTSKDLGVKLTFIEEQFPMGTAGVIRLAKDHLNSTFFMSNADELKNINLHDMFLFHREHKGVATIALTTVDDPTKYGVANLTGYNILNFIEKPSKQNAPSNLINSGFYIFEPQVVDYVPEGFAKLESDVFPKLAKENKLIGYSFSGQWFSINSMSEYKQAEKRWKGIN